MAPRATATANEISAAINTQRAILHTQPHYTSEMNACRVRGRVYYVYHTQRGKGILGKKTPHIHTHTQSREHATTKVFSLCNVHSANNTGSKESLVGG